MKFSPDEMVSATELSRRPGQYISAAAAGDRVVIIKDNSPVAALIGIHELRQLERTASAGEMLAGRLAAAEPVALSTETAPAWLAALNIDQEKLSAWRPEPGWEEASTERSLVVPIGTGLDGKPVTLDLAASSEGGTGPHGLVVGRTGSGKSSLVAAAVLGLAVRYPPTRVRFILAGKGHGSWGQRMKQLPHVEATFETDGPELCGSSGSLTTLLRNEVAARCAALKEAGHVSLADMRANRPEAAPPDLLVVLDDTEMPPGGISRDLRKELLNVYRTGPVTGISILRTAQWLDISAEVRQHESFVIALALRTEAESHNAIGVGAAATLPPHRALLHRFDPATNDHALTPFDTYNPAAQVSNEHGSELLTAALIDRIIAAADSPSSLPAPTQVPDK